MNNRQRRWFLLITISLIWGSSFILMKKALIDLSPIQVGSLRVIFTSISLILVGSRSVFTITKTEWYHISITAFIGTFFPVFLFAYAIQNIDSSIVSILNSLTPLNTLLVAVLFYGFVFLKRQVAGIFLGLIGAMILIFIGAEINPDQNYYYAFLIFLASIGYAYNVNIIKKHLTHIDALTLTTCNFILLIVPATVILWFTDFFDIDKIRSSTTSLWYVLILSIIGTALAKTIFNRLVQISSPIFSSSVTYLIPFVAIFWGVLDGEKIQLSQIFAGALILAGIYLTHNTQQS